jgi:hypothetical protein
MNKLIEIDITSFVEWFYTNNADSHICEPIGSIRSSSSDILIKNCYYCNTETKDHYRFHGCSSKLEIIFPLDKIVIEYKGHSNIQGVGATCHKCYLSNKMDKYKMDK